MPTADSKRRWFRLSPDRFVVGVLLVVGLLWMSDRFQWFGFNHHKGWTVPIAVATAGVAGFVMLLWWAASLIFHWRFQFGIRSLLAFCLACSIAAGWLAVEIEGARRQAGTVVSIRSSGGWLVYDWQDDANNHLISHPAPPTPRWLRTTLGDDFFSTVVRMYYANITDAGLGNIGGWSQLQYLDLNATKITDAGLEHVTGLVQLRCLGLAKTQITDAGLTHLKGMTHLWSLSLENTRVTDPGLEYIKGLVNLQVLDLTGTWITGDGVRYLKGLARLRTLGLSFTQVTDTGLEQINDLTQLQELTLRFTHVTDAGLKHLEGLTQLQVLDVAGTRVTDAGVKQLQRALPNCKIGR